MLSKVAKVTETMWANLANFVYSNTISELRWHLFCKHMAESDKLPPTIGALRQHVLRAHFQARVWVQASIAVKKPQFDPLQHGYYRESYCQLKPGAFSTCIV